MRKLTVALLGVGIGIVVACGSESSEFGDGTNGGDGGGNTSSGGFGTNDGAADGSDLEGDGAACTTSEASAALQPIYLGFAFDVSGSMGELDCPFWNHDPTKKWRPVVEATVDFFEDAASTNINASLTLFPSGNDQRCNANQYTTPQVAMRVLPATQFATALRAYETAAGLPASGNYTLPMPPEGANWRGGTPTPAAVSGVVQYLRTQKTAHPDARVALVLVTDGVPQGCTDNNPIPVVTSAWNVDRIPTYVIGVKDPPTAPASAPWAQGWACGSGNDWANDYTDTTRPQATNPNALANLNAVAVAGNTTAAVLLDTGNPAATKTAFTNAINAIRSGTISCDIPRPAPPQGETFDPNRVNVSYVSAPNRTALGFDTTCAAANAWRYKGAGNEVIEICPATCDVIRKDPKARISVEFGCVRRSAVR